MRLRSNPITFVILSMFLLTALDTRAQDGEVEPVHEIRGKTDAAVERLSDAVPAANFVVNDNGDATDSTPGDMICETATGNGVCTLRAAVVEANALAGDDVITFAPTVSSIAVNTQLAITSNMTINGPGPASLTIRNIAPLSTTSRVFNITNFVVNLSGMTIADGNVTGNGGGIQNTGTLTIVNCVISGNRVNGASGIGGGIRSTNTLTVMNSVISGNASTASTSGGISFAGANVTIGKSTISGNTSSGNGGGMNISATASATITNSTISGNTAGASSGGMFTNRGTLINTTISGNTANGALATDGGGGLRIQAGVNSVSITSCTVTGNTAPNSTSGARSGIWHETGTLTIANSIIAANVAQDIQRDGTGVITSGGFNLIGENTSVTTEFPDGLPNGTNYVGTDALPLNPMIGALGYNGGPTFTHALLAGSVAIDKGNSSGSTVDQRNYFRPIDLGGIPNAPGGDGADIGSFEFQSSPSVVVSISGRVTDAGGRGLPKAIVVLTDAGGNSRFTLTSSFGYYRFDDAAIDETYEVSVQRKGYQFTPRTVFAGGNITGLDFVAEP
jgi:hypothetical protein